VDAKKGTFKIGDSTYELVSTADMDFQEARLVKRVSGGMSLGQFEARLSDGDPDAWLAQVFIAVRRTTPNVTVQQVEQLLSGQKLVTIYESVEETPGEQLPPVSVPPSNANGSSDETQNDASGGGSSAAILETSGSQP
jgi:hypothetical protein